MTFSLNMYKKLIPLLLILSFPAIAFARVPTYTATGTVTKVTDGDTIKVQIWHKAETVRLLGVDTPELSITRFGYAECYGQESTDYVASILPIGSPVYLEFYGNDRYARDLADVYIGSRTGSLIAKDIINGGYGWVYRNGIKSRNYLTLVRSELASKRASIGLWNLATCNGMRVRAMTGAIAPVTTVVSNPSYTVAPVTFADVAPITPVVPTWGFTCSNVPMYCAGVKTREEAQFYLNVCWATRFDRDNDGIACEMIK